MVDGDNDEDSVPGQTAGTVQCVLMCFDQEHLLAILGCKQVNVHQ